MFDHFKDCFDHVFRVINATIITSDEGTGLVHMAPAFGPEDFKAATKAGTITATLLPPNPIDNSNRFTSDMPEYEGQHVKVVERTIIKDLKIHGRLVVGEQIKQSVESC